MSEDYSRNDDGDLIIVEEKEKVPTLNLNKFSNEKQKGLLDYMKLAENIIPEDDDEGLTTRRGDSSFKETAIDQY